MSFTFITTESSVIIQGISYGNLMILSKLSFDKHLFRGHAPNFHIISINLPATGCGVHQIKKGIHVSKNLRDTIMREEFS